MALDIVQIQVSNLKKMDYQFYRTLAAGEEPLTYTCKLADQEMQVEVNARTVDHGVAVGIDFDTNWGGRWRKSEKYKELTITPDDKWLE